MMPPRTPPPSPSTAPGNICPDLIWRSVGYRGLLNINVIIYTYYLYDICVAYSSDVAMLSDFIAIFNHLNLDLATVTHNWTGWKFRNWSRHSSYTDL